MSIQILFISTYFVAEFSLPPELQCATKVDAYRGWLFSLSICNQRFDKIKVYSRCVLTQYKERPDRYDDSIQNEIAQIRYKAQLFSHTSNHNSVNVHKAL